ncbi:MAG: cation transporter [Anaerolineae bacterium]
MENVLGSLDGVVDARADFVAGTAVVTYDPARVVPEQMVEAINTQTFFQASPPSTEGATSRFNSLPFVASGVLIMLVGVGAWQVVVRRQASQPVDPPTSQRTSR